MNLAEIREKLAKADTHKQSNKDLWRNWLTNGCVDNWDFGLTVMPKKVLCMHLADVRNVKDNKAYRHLTKYELELALGRLVKLINKKVLKHSNTTYGNKLDILMVVEGENSNKDLHAHFAIRKPEKMSVKQFVKLVNYALYVSGEFEIYNQNYNANTDKLDEKYRYKLDVIDEDWLYYITKELDKDEVNNLYFM